MAVETWADALKLVREADGMEIDLGPLQGLWTEEQYLRLTDQTNLLIEFTDGVIEVLPMPTDDHQVVVAFIYEALLAFIRPRGGKVLFAPLRVRIRPGRHREPDILLVRDARDPRRQNRYWLRAPIWWSRSSAPISLSATRGRSRSITPMRASSNIGSSIR